MTAHSGRQVEKALVVEIALVLGLIALAVLLYWRPAAEGALSPTWWHAVALGGLFFAIVALHTWRSRHRSRRALHEAIREDATAAIEADPAETKTSPSSEGARISAGPEGSTRPGHPEGS